MYLDKLLQTDDSPLARGVLINSFGVLLKISRPLYLVLFARLLGIEGFGVYMLAFAIQEAVSKVAILGLNWGGKQVVGYLYASDREAEIRSAAARITWLTLGASTLTAGLLYAACEIFKSDGGSVAETIQVFAVGMPFVCGMYVVLYMIRPTLDMRYEMYVTSVIEPVAVLVFGVIFFYLAAGVQAIAWGHVVAAIIAFAISLHYLNKVFPSGSSAGECEMDWGMLAHGSVTMGTMEFLSNVKQRLDLFFVAQSLPMSYVGAYGAIVEVGSVLRKVKAVFDPVLMPLAQRLHLRGEAIELQEQVFKSVRWSYWLGFFILGIFILVPERILGLFGPEFVGPMLGLALIVYAIGQFFHMSLGLSEGLLAITGHANAALVNTLVLIVVNVLLLVVLVPPYGVMGAAVATSVSYLVVTLWRLVQTKERLGLDLVDTTLFYMLAGWSVCLLAATFLSNAFAGLGRPAEDFTSVLIFILAFLAWRRVERSRRLRRSG